MSQTIRLTTAQALIKFLNAQYVSVDGVETPFVEGVFHIFGHGNVLGIGQALSENPGHLRNFQGKNEQGMGHAAIAFAKQHLGKKIFAVTASSGPGSANMLVSAATAFANNVPVLFLPADTFASRQPDPVLQQMEHAHSNALTTNDAFRAVTRYWDRVQRPEQLMSALIRAFEVLTNPATAGPVAICIPQDTEAEAYDYPLEFFNKRVHYMDRRPATERELTAAADLIKASKRPVIIVGGDAKNSAAGEVLKQWSLQCNLPLVSTSAGKSTVSWEFANDLGGMGVLGTSAANKAVMAADLIIGIGTKYDDFTTSSKSIFNEQAKFINISPKRCQTYKLDAMQVVADPRAAVQQLLPLLADYVSAYGSELSELKAEWTQERDRLAQVQFSREHFEAEIGGQYTQERMNEYADTLGTELTQTSVFIKLNDLVADNAIVVGAAGSIPGDMQRLWNVKQPNTYHLEYGYSCMGYELAGSVGAKLAAPEQEVYTLLGDGSFLMLHTELVTALQYGIKINVVLFDNSGFGCINNLQLGHGCDNFGTEFRDAAGQIMNVDYAAIGTAYGAKSYQVNTMEQFERAIADAKQQQVSTLIHIKVLPKTMSGDYPGSWWNVGISSLSDRESVQAAYAKKQEGRQKARKY
ncbi:3D-(3,5/4)-trihydroxycyclohexane-1,2-dione acylhydrolase (decyclizing) [Paenibacillus azoreducens]|uniref:3D-(3,5/4)-trihydroxycyclohexane-1,2-dione acylhydrolase (decyclizing) n=1 Tax=Paenibacillus azoreducens TaxID=116718 RepID=UPI0039F4E14F